MKAAKQTRIKRGGAAPSAGHIADGMDAIKASVAELAAALPKEEPIAVRWTMSPLPSGSWLTP